MLFVSMLVQATAALAVLQSSLVAHHEQSHCSGRHLDSRHYERIVSNYLGLWAGDLSLLDRTISPNVLLKVDRFPLSTDCGSGAGSAQLNVTSSEGFGQFVSNSRIGYSRYQFDSKFWFGSEDKIAIRWSLDGIIGENFTRIPTTLHPGDPITYDGTEILVLDKCTGLAKEVYSAQDLINGFHNFGLKSVTV